MGQGLRGKTLRSRGSLLPCFASLGNCWPELLDLAFVRDVRSPLADQGIVIRFRRSNNVATWRYCCQIASLLTRSAYRACSLASGKLTKPQRALSYAAGCLYIQILYINLRYKQSMRRCYLFMGLVQSTHLRKSQRVNYVFHIIKCKSCELAAVSKVLTTYQFRSSFETTFLVQELGCIGSSVWRS